MSDKITFTDNFLFKVLFSKNENQLLELLNSFPEFQNEKKILKINVLNPELPKATELEKLSVLDIHAEDLNGNKFIIEMQSQIEVGFEKRILFYSSKIYTKSLKKGEKYFLLPKIYSISFLEFDLLKTKNYHSVFQLREKENPELILTDDLEFHIIELRKTKSELSKLVTDFETWLYLLRNGHDLKENEMNTLVKKNPKLKKTLDEYKEYTSNPKNKNLIEARKKSRLVLNGQIAAAKLEGIEKGKLVTSIELLAWGMPMVQVCKITGLTEKQILDFKKSQVK